MVDSIQCIDLWLRTEVALAPYHGESERAGNL